MIVFKHIHIRQNTGLSALFHNRILKSFSSKPFAVIQEKQIFHRYMVSIRKSQNKPMQNIRNWYTSGGIRYLYPTVLIFKVKICISQKKQLALFYTCSKQDEAHNPQILRKFSKMCYQQIQFLIQVIDFIYTRITLLIVAATRKTGGSGRGL